MLKSDVSLRFTSNKQTIGFGKRDTNNKLKLYKRKEEEGAYLQLVSLQVFPSSLPIMMGRTLD